MGRQREWAGGGEGLETSEDLAELQVEETRCVALSAALACAGPLGFDATSADGASTARCTLLYLHCGDELGCGSGCTCRVTYRRDRVVCEGMRALQCQSVVVLNISGFTLAGSWFATLHIYVRNRVRGGGRRPRAGAGAGRTLFPVIPCYL